METQVDLKNKFSFILPRGFLSLGFIFLGIGIILSVMRFYFGIKPDIFEQKVFALYSFYLESKTLQVMNNQLMEEIIGLFVIIGLFFIAFSKEKKEDHNTNFIRLQALFISTYLNTLFLILSIIFTFGFAFLYTLIVNMGSFMLIYIIVFRVLVVKNKPADKL